MRKTIFALVLVALTGSALLAIAGTDKAASAKAGTNKTEAASAAAGTEKAASKTTTLTGEIVDTGCYLGHEAKGEKHASCATKCISGGMPMGLLTADGALYLLTPSHDNADAFNALKGMAAKTVSVTGNVMERAGMKAIDVTAYKASAAAAEVKAETKKASGY